MPTKCTKCRINWSHLYEERDDQNNQINELCPICRSAVYFEENEDSPSYKMSVNGKIVNSVTGEVLKLWSPHLAAKAKRDFDVDEWRKNKAAKEKRTDAALDAYQNTKGSKKKKEAAMSEVMAKDLKEFL